MLFLLQIKKKQFAQELKITVSLLKLRNVRMLLAKLKGNGYSLFSNYLIEQSCEMLIPHVNITPLNA